jgi:hypothetical protein
MKNNGIFFEEIIFLEHAHSCGRKCLFSTPFEAAIVDFFGRMLFS